MTRKLIDEDRQAVDLVLDTFTTVGQEDGTVAVAGTPVEQRVQSVQQILSALSQMPAVEPPDDLIERTLRRIEQVPHQAQLPEYLGPDQLPA
jgi:hypothetical protein